MINVEQNVESVSVVNTAGVTGRVTLFLTTGMSLACENMRFSSLFAAGDVSRGGTSATRRQKFHADDANQCLHNMGFQI